METSDRDMKISLMRLAREVKESKELIWRIARCFFEREVAELERSIISIKRVGRTGIWHDCLWLFEGFIGALFGI